MLTSFHDQSSKGAGVVCAPDRLEERINLAQNGQDVVRVADLVRPLVCRELSDVPPPHLSIHKGRLHVIHLRQACLG